MKLTTGKLKRFTRGFIQIENESEESILIGAITSVVVWGAFLRVGLSKCIERPNTHSLWQPSRRIEYWVYMSGREGHQFPNGSVIVDLDSQWRLVLSGPGRAYDLDRLLPHRQLAA